MRDTACHAFMLTMPAVHVSCHACRVRILSVIVDVMLDDKTSFALLNEHVSDIAKMQAKSIHQCGCVLFHFMHSWYTCGCRKPYLHVVAPGADMPTNDLCTRSAEQQLLLIRATVTPLNVTTQLLCTCLYRMVEIL